MKYKDLHKVEVELLKDFPVIKETLSRMGIKNTRKRLFTHHVIALKRMVNILLYISIALSYSSFIPFLWKFK